MIINPLKLLCFTLVCFILTGCAFTGRKPQLSISQVSSGEPSETASLASGGDLAGTVQPTADTTPAPAGSFAAAIPEATPDLALQPSEDEITPASSPQSQEALQQTSAPTPPDNSAPSPATEPSTDPANTKNETPVITVTPLPESATDNAVSPAPGITVKPSHAPEITPSPLPSATAAVLATAKPKPSTYPLQVSSNKRYLIDANNNPFLVFADTGWMLFSNITLQDAEFYLETRRKQNVNSILCYAAPFFIDATNKQGEHAFLNNDLSKPNDKYFEHVDKVIKLAASKGMQVIMCPVEMCNYAPYYTKGNARVLGRYMGKRYRDYDNIIWFTGGDIRPSGEQVEITNSLAAGIRDYDKRHLISFHPAGGNSSSDFFNSEPWLDFNMVQVYSPDSPKSYQSLLADYGKTPVRPTILAETCYEDNPANSPFQIRRSMAWGILSGGFGLSYGNQVLYKFIADPQRDWKTVFDHPAFRQTVNIYNFIKSSTWQKLVPDQTHSLLTDGYGYEGSLEYVAAALAEDGSFAVIYVPVSREITVDMSKFNSGKQAKWFDPTNNTYTNEGSCPNSGSRTFQARPENSSDEQDWFLIIE